MGSQAQCDSTGKTLKKRPLSFSCIAKYPSVTAVENNPPITGFPLSLYYYIICMLSRTNQNQSALSNLFPNRECCVVGNQPDILWGKRIHIHSDLAPPYHGDERVENLGDQSTTNRIRMLNEERKSGVENKTVGGRGVWQGGDETLVPCVPAP